MSETLNLNRQQTLGEEIANSISHGVGFLAAAAITPFLVLKAIPVGALAVTGCSNFWSYNDCALPGIYALSRISK
jgi:hemolysin III